MGSCWVPQAAVDSPVDQVPPPSPLAHAPAVPGLPPSQFLGSPHSPEGPPLSPRPRDKQVLGSVLPHTRLVLSQVHSSWECRPLKSTTGPRRGPGGGQGAFTLRTGNLPGPAWKWPGVLWRASASPGSPGGWAVPSYPRGSPLGSAPSFCTPGGLSAVQPHVCCFRRGRDGRGPDHERATATRRGCRVPSSA